MSHHCCLPNRVGLLGSDQGSSLILFLPRQVGLFFMIESMAFLDDEARLLSTVSYDLGIIE